MTTNGLGLDKVAPALGRGRSRPGQRQPRHGPARHVPHRSPGATGSTTSSAGSRRPQAAGLTPVKINAVLLRGVNDDQAPELLDVVPRARLRAALHRADAARRPARLEPRRRWSPRTRSSASLETAFVLTAASRRAGQCAGRAVPRRRRPGDRRHHRLGDAAVLRRLRPRAADGRRPGPQLPVRARGVRPADGAARRRRRRGASPTAGGAAMWTKRPGHGIDDESFLQPARPMSRHRRLTACRPDPSSWSPASSRRSTSRA